MRSGLYTDQAACTSTYDVLRDWDGTGIEFRSYRVGPGSAPGTLVCVAPAVGRYADINARTDLKAIVGARAYITDVGAGGSFWRVAVSGTWHPDGPIICTGTPLGAITAPIGSTALRTDGGTTTTLYVKESGTDATGWVAK